jgi:hypothetical protein
MTEIFGIDVEETITSRAELRDIIAPPNARTADKVIDHVDDLAQKFIATKRLWCCLTGPEIAEWIPSKTYCGILTSASFS